MNNMACQGCGEWGRWRFGLCAKCQEMRLEIDRQLHKEAMEHLRERLDYARDRLLLKLAHTLLHVTFDCAPTGAQMLRKDLEVTADIFQTDLEKFYPGGES